MTGQTPIFEFFAVWPWINPIILFQRFVQCRSHFKAVWMSGPHSLNILYFQVKVSASYSTEEPVRETRRLDITCLCGELKVFELPQIWPFCLLSKESVLCSAPVAVWTIFGNVCKTLLHPLLSSFSRLLLLPRRMPISRRIETLDFSAVFSYISKSICLTYSTLIRLQWN